MFTGIIKELGIVQRFDRKDDLYRLVIESKEVSKSVDIGGSAAVNGVCLTLVGKNKKALSFDVMEETVRKTTFAVLKNGEKVNLEGALKADGSLGGHFVLGHIDCVGKIKRIQKSGKEFFMEIGFPGQFGNLVVEKGSIAIDGVSLTVGEIGSSIFKVYLIPYTIKETTLGFKKTGNDVNLEFDIIGKYAAGLPAKTSRVTEDFLKSKGF